MKILLIRPDGIADEIIPPISLGLIASQVRDRHNVVILDAMKESCGAEQIARVVADGNFQLVGFQAWTKDVHEILATCKIIRRITPGVIIVVGGIQPTMQPVATLRFFGEMVDFAWSGEAESGFGAFADALAVGTLGTDILQTIPGLVWRDGEVIKVNKNYLVDDLDSLGLPAWDLMPPSSYPCSPHGAFFRNFPIAPLVVTRGCPYPCRFCSAKVASGSKLRSRSLDSVIGELHLLHDHFGVREFQIEDDNFTLNRSYVEEFCLRLLDSALDMTWSFPNGVRLDTLDPTLLALMHRAGCYALNFGIESGSPRILDSIDKKTTVEQMRSQIEMAKQAGFELGGFFIIGFPGETKGEIEQTISYALSLPLDRVGVSYFQPFPGTAFFDDLVRNGEIADDWGFGHHTSLHDITYITPTLTEAELVALRQHFLAAFYARPKILLGMMRQVRSPAHFYYMAKRSLRWLRV